MNIKIDRNRNFLFQASFGNRKEKAKTETKNISAEQLMINQFKEQNSRENTRTTEIWGKFKAGKELSPEELEYLAKMSPDLYRQVREIMLERKAMEEQMRLAESKEEVTEIHVNEMNNIQATMGTGEQALANAEKNMARVNQMRNAYTEYTATLEYKEKEDIESKTEEMREMLEELKRQQEAYQDRIPEEFVEEDEDKEKIIAEEKKDKDDSETLLNEFLTADIDYEGIENKLRELYRAEKSYENRDKGNDVDVSV